MSTDTTHTHPQRPSLRLLSNPQDSKEVEQQLELAGQARHLHAVPSDEPISGTQFARRLIAEALTDNARWREERAAINPDDERHAQAAESATRPRSKSRSLMTPHSSAATPPLWQTPWTGSATAATPPAPDCFGQPRRDRLGVLPIRLRVGSDEPDRLVVGIADNVRGLTDDDEYPDEIPTTGMLLGWIVLSIEGDEADGGLAWRTGFSDRRPQRPGTPGLPLSSRRGAERDQRRSISRGLASDGSPALMTGSLVDDAKSSAACHANLIS